MSSNRRNISKLAIAFALSLVLASSAFSQLAGKPGAFSRMGLGARGMGMSGAMSAVITGELNHYYNPAVIPFSPAHTAALSYSFLTLDRSLNGLYYSQPIGPSAGISVGILNAGVRKIDGRDNDGFHSEDYSTSENQFSFGFANRMSSKLSIGVGIKVYYYSLFEDVSSTAVGFDIGLIYRVSDRLSFGATAQDINTKYKWDTSKIYDELGNSTTERFPVMRKIGLSYALTDDNGIITAEFVDNTEKDRYLKCGVELNPSRGFSLRAGIDRLTFSGALKTTASFGFTIRQPLDVFTPALDYAYILEPYGISAIHVISLSTTF